MAAWRKYINFVPKFNDGDVVFAKQTGYVHWPARLLEFLTDTGKWRVLYFASNDRYNVKESNLWNYQEHKARFVNPINLEYEDFKEAVKLADEYIYEIDFVRSLNEQRPLLVGNEEQFVDLINGIRANLTLTHRNIKFVYENIERIQNGIQASTLLLVRNFEAVETVWKLCHYVGNAMSPEYDVQQQIDATLIRNKARKLFQSFKEHFKKPFKKEKFWLEYCYHKEIFEKHTEPVPNQESLYNGAAINVIRPDDSNVDETASLQLSEIFLEILSEVNEMSDLQNDVFEIVQLRDRENDNANLQSEVNEVIELSDTTSEDDPSSDLFQLSDLESEN